MSFVSMPTVDVFTGRIRLFGSLLVTFRHWSLRFPVTAIDLLSDLELTLSSSSRIECPPIAIVALVCVWNSPGRIIAENMLPRLALVTLHSATVIICKRADTLDGVGLFFLVQVRLGVGAVCERRG